MVDEKYLASLFELFMDALFKYVVNEKITHTTIGALLMQSLHLLVLLIAVLFKYMANEEIIQMIKDVLFHCKTYIYIYIYIRLFYKYNIFKHVTKFTHLNTDDAKNIYKKK